MVVCHKGSGAMKIGIMTSSMDWEIFGGQIELGNYIHNLDEKELISPTIHFSDEIMTLHYLFTKEEMLLQDNRC